MRMLIGVAMLGVVVALAVGSGIAGAAGAARGKPVSGAHFATVAPAGWSVASKGALGGRQFTLTSPGTKLDVVGVPTTARGIGVTILEASARSVAKKLKRKSLPSSPVAVFSLLVGTPSGAKGVRGTARPLATTFHGSPAAKAGYAYTYHKRPVVQQDIVVLRGGRVYVIEADAGAAQALPATGALVNVTGSAWRWR
jgi:hypothetical protein